MKKVAKKAVKAPVKKAPQMPMQAPVGGAPIMKKGGKAKKC